MPPGVAVVDAFKSPFFSIFSLYVPNFDPFFQTLSGMAKTTFMSVKMTTPPIHLPLLPHLMLNRTNGLSRNAVSSRYMLSRNHSQSANSNSNPSRRSP
jgi:hypothetical protein